jgi:hypothetical protein
LTLGICRTLAFIYCHNDFTAHPARHIHGQKPGAKLMQLAAEGFRRGKAKHPHLFVAAWYPGVGNMTNGSEPYDNYTTAFSSLMRDGTFDLAMFEAYDHCAGLCAGPDGPCWPDDKNMFCADTGITEYYPRFQYARAQGWISRGR